MNQITREQAFDIAKYKYKLVDKEGEILEINCIVGSDRVSFYAWDKNNKPHHVFIEKIGTDYFILCRDLSQLTETIEHEGESFVPIVELAKIAFPGISMDWELYPEINKAINNYGLTFGYENDMFYTVSSMNIPNQLQLFDKLQSWHFNLDFPQETTKPL